MNEKFTPGPWNKKEINICSQHKAGLSLAFLTTSDWRKQEEGEANANLIVTAPDMYSAIKTHCTFCDETECGECIFAEVLKKARGES